MLRKYVHIYCNKEEEAERDIRVPKKSFIATVQVCFHSQAYTHKAKPKDEAKKKSWKLEKKKVATWLVVGR